MKTQIITYSQYFYDSSIPPFSQIVVDKQITMKYLLDIIHLKRSHYSRFNIKVTYYIIVE